MTELAHTNPKRIFTFGCSFTEYRWATWANILAYELDCTFYNYGKSGAGNYFIANQVAQADCYHNFTKDDLVIICWTNVSREDRWIDNDGWLTPGNIYTQNSYDKKFLHKWANQTHFAMRDFSLIKLTDELLSKKTNYHHFQMLDLATNINQWETNATEDLTTEIKSQRELYKTVLDKIEPSFYDVLWNGDIDYKWNKDWETVHKNYSDGHPTILEHFEYLDHILDYDFSSRTKDKVEETHENWKKFIEQGLQKHKVKKPIGIYEMPNKWLNALRNNHSIVHPNDCPYEILH